MRLLPYGTTAVLIDEIDHPHDWCAAIRAANLDGIVDLVPGLRTVLISCVSPRFLADATAALPGLVVEAAPPASAFEVEIPVHYDGPDLESVASLLSMSISDVIEIHSGGVYSVAFCGFAPGFGYMQGLDPALHLPRRSTPRTRVPAGSVAIAAEFTGVYPNTAPGGWHLLGSTATKMFDPQRDRPAFLEPGHIVRFLAL